MRHVSRQDGLATTPVAKMMKVPSFRDPVVMKHTDAQLAEITENGKGSMPEFKTKLSAGQIHDVIAFIRHLQK